MGYAKIYIVGVLTVGKRLKSRHVQFIAIGGMIGTYIYFAGYCALRELG